MFDISTVYIFSSIITPNSSWKNIHWLTVELWTILENGVGEKKTNKKQPNDCLKAIYMFIE